MAEHSGVIGPLGEWVMHEACRQGQAWREAGLPDLTLAVNVSPRQFHLTDLAGCAASALSASGYPPTLLELEITEGALRADRWLAGDGAEPRIVRAGGACAAEAAGLKVAAVTGGRRSARFFATPKCSLSAARCEELRKSHKTSPGFLSSKSWGFSKTFRRADI
ncbi:hypothetical protein AVHM3334_14220 [Acidovorax sp. SUPP3334]|nr:hypothetical protein AVHM3334_14220 [Acidovorax sp. SUPP3334]